jgi:hypothetical protein
MLPWAPERFLTTWSTSRYRRQLHAELTTLRAVELRHQIIKTGRLRRTSADYRFWRT